MGMFHTMSQVKVPQNGHITLAPSSCSPAKSPEAAGSALTVFPRALHDNIPAGRCQSLYNFIAQSSDAEFGRRGG